MLKTVKTYVIGILIPLLVGGLSAFLTRGSMDLYSDIVQPALAPPAILFPIVWTLLYILMGVGSVLVYRSDAMQGDKTQALFIYALQLFVNFLWSIFFFNMRAFLFSFIWIVLLWLLIWAMIFAFRKCDKVASWLQLPYLLWVSFASYLNLSIYLLNR